MYCERYLCDSEPDFSVTLTQQDIIFEREITERERALENLPPKTMRESLLERTALQRKITEKLFEYDTLLFHGSVIAVDGEAYLFTAKSGTGKSTHTNLWREMLGERAVMVNDDKPFLRIIDHSVYACGSPWCGKHGLASNVSVPLQGICVLSRGKENLIQRADAASVMEFLRQQAHSPLDADLLAHSFELIDTITKYVPLWQLQCNMEQEAALVSYSEMSRDNESQEPNSHKISCCK
jgi:hypothetical protein